MKVINNIIIVILYVFCVCPANSIAQGGKECMEEVLSIEDKTSYRNDTTIKHKNIFLSYSVRVTDWENQVTISNVKVYKHMDNMDLYTEQAQIHQDSKEVVMILPIQKVAIISSTNEKLNNTKIGESFFEMRRSFLDSCETVRCDKQGSKKTVELKVKNPGVSNNITGIVYEYDSEQQKILFVRVSYNENYKIKQMQINYKELSLNSTYQFAASRKYLFDKKGNLLPKLADYELMDNRDQKPKKK